MKYVYLIRHALPDFPGGERICLGRTDLPLGKEGLAQAEIMAKNLPPVSRVYSSPLCRAVQTAQAVGEPVILEGLQELSAGEWDGLTFREIQKRYPKLYAARGRDKTLALPGGEPAEEGLARFVPALNQAAREAPADVAVVAHGGIIALFLRTLDGIGQKPEYTQVIPLLWEDGRFYLQEETDHA